MAITSQKILLNGRKDEFPGLIEGRVVHFVLDRGPNIGRHISALVIDVWFDEEGNRTGFVGLRIFPAVRDEIASLRLVSVAYDGSGSKPGTWSWIERV